MARHAVGEGKGGRNKGEKNADSVYVNSEKIKELFKEKRVSIKAVSNFVLGKEGSTLAYQLKRGAMPKEDFEKLMDYYKIEDKYLYLDLPAFPSNRVESENTQGVVHLNYDGPTKDQMDKLLDTMSFIFMQLEDMTKKMNSLENAIGAVATSNAQMLETDMEVLNSIVTIKSTTNAINGRIKDEIAKQNNPQLKVVNKK